jgi:hypothetical protein
MQPFNTGTKKLKAAQSAALTALLFTASAMANQTYLPLRSEAGTCLYQASTTQTVEAGFGSALVRLPFTGTKTYHFYSPPLTTPANLATTDRASGQVFMENNSSSSANDFSATGQMDYYDYDPATGNENLIVSTGSSSPLSIPRSSTKNWALPKVNLLNDKTIAAGHLLHLALTVVVTSGTPGSANLLVNGAVNASTTGLLPQNNNLVTWNFSGLTSAPDATISVSATSVGANSTGNGASVQNLSGASYAWSINNGVITAGQGTSQITWSAGSSGPVSLGVTVQKGCVANGAANVAVAVVATQAVPASIVSIAQLLDKTVRVVGNGVSGRTYQLQATADLSSPQWTSIGTVVAALDGSFQIVDSDAVNYAARFYRTLSQ